MWKSEQIYDAAIIACQKEKEVYTIEVEGLKAFMRILDIEKKRQVELFNEDYQLLIPVKNMNYFDDEVGTTESANTEEKKEGTSNEETPKEDSSEESKE